MNPLQAKVYDYLTIPSHPERLVALRDLIERSLFMPSDSETITLNILRRYADENPRGFCAEGVARFQAAFLPPPVETFTGRLHLDFEVDGYYTRKNQYIDGRSLAGDLRRLLEGTEFPGYGGRSTKVRVAGMPRVEKR